MSINAKLAIPALIGMAVILIFIETYWKPMRLDLERSTFKDNIHELLVLEQSELIRDLLENDLASVYAALENLQRQYNGRWYNISFTNENGKRLYPLFPPAQNDFPENHEMIPFAYALNVNGMYLGQITFDADWGRQSKIVISEINNIRNMVLLLIIIALLVTLFSQYQIVYLPLKRLVTATEKITQGQIDEFLPVSSNDEIGVLTQAFNAMMVELRFQKQALDHHAIVSTTDANGLITYANDKFLKISQYDLEEVLGQTHALIKSDMHSDAFFAYMWETITDGKVWQGEICNRSKNGRNYWVYSTIVPFVNEQGQCERYISIRTDITTSKQNALDLQEAKDAAEAGYQAKSDFLANMSHEIRTPMNAIIGFSDLAMAADSSKEEVSEYLKKIQGASRILLNLINDILDLSKIENGKMKLENICYDLPLVIDETTQVVQRQFPSKNLTLKIKIFPDVPGLVLGDPNRLGQVILNLVGNAFKFTEQGSIKIEVRCEGEMIRFCVEDTGIGMSEAQIETIFDAFTQADVSTTRRFGGTGLGTTISKHIVQQMGGRIWVSSQLDKGSQFYFEIPLAIPDELAVANFYAHSNKSSDYISPRLFKILLAEDVEVNARLVTLRLEKMGHQVDWVENGRMAVEAVQKRNYDLVLMDVMMPVMNGREACQAIRRQERDGEHLPIIALTASVFEQDRRDCIQSGMDAVEFKPVNFNQLLRTMERVVERDEQITNTSSASTIEIKPIIDFSTIEKEVNYKPALKRWNDAEVYLKALKSFAGKKELIPEIDSYFKREDGDDQAILAVLHGFRGVADNLGIQNVALLLNLMERQLSKGDKSGAGKTFASFKSVFNRTLKVIEQLQGNPTTQSEFTGNAQQTARALEIIRELKIKMRTLNPDEVEPGLEQLSQFVASSDIEPILHLVEVFDFKQAEQMLLVLESRLSDSESALHA